ncbi:hypothetical protein AX17_000572 [Amanita inopinata Kibby_2008]|nr:hypothetical protein AX17_000572 [Amanita inopinata Kibby_2008]
MDPQGSTSTQKYVYHQPPFVRDYVLEDDDEGMRGVMDRIAREEEAIRYHNEALQAIEDAAFAKALELSKETALHEARNRARQSNARIVRSRTGSQDSKYDRLSYISVSSSTTLVFMGSAQEPSKLQLGRTTRTRVTRTAMANSGAPSNVKNKYKADTPGQVADIVTHRFDETGSLLSSAMSQHENRSRHEDGSAEVVSSRRPSLSSKMSRSSSQTDSNFDSGSEISRSPSDQGHLDSLLRGAAYPSSDHSSLSRELLSSVGFFVSPQNCSHCGKSVERFPSSKDVNGPHASCPACGVNHCRGCFVPVQCPRECPGGEDCPVTDCCSHVRAIAVFDSLSAFNIAFLTALRECNPDSNPQNYIHVFLRKRHVSTRKFERTLVDTLRILPRLLQPLGAEMHPSITRLISLSYLPQVMHGYLEHEDIGDWVMHSEAYIAILQAFKELPACGLGSVFSEPFTCDRKWGYKVPLGINQEAADAQWFCLKDAVKHLDAHYKRFMALSSRITFPATLFKMHQLSDGILYLLLQQIVD